MLFSEPISVLWNALHEQSCFYEQPSSVADSSPPHSAPDFDPTFGASYSQTDSFEAFMPQDPPPYEEHSFVHHSSAPVFYNGSESYGIDPSIPTESFPAHTTEDLCYVAPAWPAFQTPDYGHQQEDDLASWLQSVPMEMQYPAHDDFSSFSMNDFLESIATDSSPPSSFHSSLCSSPDDSHLHIPFPSAPHPPPYPDTTQRDWVEVPSYNPCTSDHHHSAGVPSDSYAQNAASSSQSSQSLSPLVLNFPLNADPSTCTPASEPTSSVESAPRRRKRSRPKKACTNCNITTTPMWRRNPATHELLCNACGIYLQTRNRRRPTELYSVIGTGAGAGSGSEDVVEKGGVEYAASVEEDWKGRVCDRCETKVTSVWRKDSEGKTVCNACGVYRRMKGKERPLHLKTDRVKPRFKLVGELALSV